MRRAGAAAVFILLGLVTAPAGAQLPDPQLSPSDPNVLESDGAIVLTVSKSTPGRLEYRTTSDECGGACSGVAKAPQDYGAVSGEMVFTEPGSKTITIAIVDDDLAEWHETFTFQTHEVDDAAGWPTGRSLTVGITDDDSQTDGEPGAPSVTTATTAAARPASSAPATMTGERASALEVGAPPSATALPPADVEVEVEVAPEDLVPGAGFELTSDGTAGPAPGRGGGRRASAPSWRSG